MTTRPNLAGIPGTLATVAFLLCTFVVAAQARTGANPPARVTLGTEGPRAGMGAGNGRLALPSSAQVFVPVPLPAGAVQIDSTWYDLQDMGSLGHHIEVGADDRVHMTWQDDFCELGGGCPPNLAAPQPHPNRGMAYAVRDAAGTWSNLGKVTDPRLPVCCIRDLAGGFGSIAITSGGRAAIAQHLNEDGCDLRGYFHLEDAPGSSAFRGYLTPIVSPSLLFPQVVANPINLSQTPATVRTPAPEFGQHTEEILQKLGYEKGEIEGLKKESAI